MGLFKKDTMAQKITKAVKKTVKEIGPHKPSISEKIVKTVKKIGPKKPSVADRIEKALTANNPPVKQVTVTYGGRDDDFD